MWERNLGLRLNHFLLTPCLVEHRVIAEVDREVRSWEKTSDHAPVYTKLDGVGGQAP